LGRSLETPTGSIWPLFLTAHAVLVEKIEMRLAAAEFPALTWYDVLWGLERAPEQRLRMSELAEKVVLSRSNLTRLVDRLEEAGLVARERSEEDRRGAYAVLTLAGRDLRKRMWPEYQAAIRDLFDRYLDDSEVATLNAVFRRLIDAARGVTPARKGPIKAGRHPSAAPAGRRK
jgi:DNA-binding MarR family transcriptional regulator